MENTKTKHNLDRPRFLDEISRGYNGRLKNIILLTGNINDVFWSSQAQNFISLEQTLWWELKDKFNLVRVDMASGVSFCDQESEQEIFRICESIDGLIIPPDRKLLLKKHIEDSRNNPLASLVLLKGITEAFFRASQIEKEKNIKPLGVILQFAGSIFPAGDYTRLAEIDRQRLVFFLSWMMDPLFVASKNLVLLVNPTKTEVNTKIFLLPNTASLEIPLPESEERSRVVEVRVGRNTNISFELGKERFVADTAGLSTRRILDILGVAEQTKEPVTSKQVVAEVNNIIQAEMGSIVRIKYPNHGPENIIGYREAGKIFTDIFERCEDASTAISAVIVSGPNGSGKTFQLEAYASVSGRVVIELTGMRGSYFGETDNFFELLRWHIATFGKILILVDEAHTAFGSVHGRDTHETEKRLAGNILKMMGDSSYFGKVLWGLMTSRPDELDPDIQSRAPLQIPIFDLEGSERRQFVEEIFSRKKIMLEQNELDEIILQTGYYSNRDYDNLVREVMATRRKKDATVLQVLTGWQASRSIQAKREFQTLVAVQHCSYPGLLPEKYRNMNSENINRRISELKWLFNQ